MVNVTITALKEKRGSALGRQDQRHHGRMEEGDGYRSNGNHRHCCFEGGSMRYRAGNTQQTSSVIHRGTYHKARVMRNGTQDISNRGTSACSNNSAEFHCSPWIQTATNYGTAELNAVTFYRPQLPRGGAVDVTLKIED